MGSKRSDINLKGTETFRKLWTNFRTVGAILKTSDDSLDKTHLSFASQDVLRASQTQRAEPYAPGAPSISALARLACRALARLASRGLARLAEP